MNLCSRVPVRSLVPCLILLCSFAFSNHAHAKRIVLDRSVVTVNDDIILASDIESFRAKAKSKNFQELFGGLDPKKLESRDAVLQLLIEEKLIDQQVKKLELTASEQEVERHIRTILERNQITQKQLTARLKDLNTTFQEYQEGIRRQLERRNLVEREIKPMMEVSDEELRHFMMRNGEAATGTRYQLAHILITTPGPAGQKRAEKVLAEALAKPEGFAELAKNTSDDAATAESGGDLGLLSTDAMSKDFQEAAKKTAPGKVYGKVVKSPGGLHIVKVNKSEALSFADLPEDRKTELRNQLMSQELEKKMTLWLERKRNDAHIVQSGAI